MISPAWPGIAVTAPAKLHHAMGHDPASMDSATHGIVPLGLNARRMPLPEGRRTGRTGKARGLAVVMAGELLEAVARLTIVGTLCGFAALPRLVLEIVDIVHIAPAGLSWPM